VEKFTPNDLGLGLGLGGLGGELRVRVGVKVRVEVRVRVSSWVNFSTRAPGVLAQATVGCCVAEIYHY